MIEDIISNQFGSCTVTKKAKNGQIPEIDLEYKSIMSLPSSTPPHRHANFYELELFVSGSGIYKINDHSCKYKKGSLFLMTPLDIHSFDIKEKSSYYMINFAESAVLPEYLNILFNTSLNFVQFENLDKITNYCQLLLKENEGSHHFQENNKKMLLNLIIAEIIKNAKTDGFHNTSALINEIIKYIRIHITEPLSLEELAKTFNISPSYLSILFKKNMNETFKRYVIDLRLRLAINLLLQTEMTITEICYQCGFSTIGNFLRRFKEKFKVTPNEYRKNYKTE